MKSIAFVLYTKGLEYDDRVRKEALFLSTFARVTIFHITPENKQETGTTSYGIPFRQFSLKTRRLLPSKRFTLLKSLEFFITAKKYFQSYDVVWAHDFHAATIPLLLPKKLLVWDLHELPDHFLKNRFTKKVFKYIQKRCRLVIHANPQRIDYLCSINACLEKETHVFLRNYPDNALLESMKRDERYDEFCSWLKGSPCVYLQGIHVATRFPKQSLDAVLAIPGLKAVVVGPFNTETKELLLSEYGDELQNRVFFTGMIPLMNIPPYIKQSSYSMVFYNPSTPNNRLCEPNRMYMAIASGKPVIVGNNEPMKDIVGKYDLGVVLKGVGNDVQEIVCAIKTLQGRYTELAKNVMQHKDRFVWSAQEPVFTHILSRVELINQPLENRSNASA